MAIDFTMYKRMQFGKLRDFNEPSIKTYVPEPKEEDYKKGYITRYFVQKINDSNSVIYEVSEFNFNRIVDNPFYIAQKLNWRLIGPKEEIKESNSKSVKLASKNVPKLIMYLPNYLQFSK